MVNSNYNFNKKEVFPFEPGKPREWLTIHKLPATEPRRVIGHTWQELLPGNAQALAEVIEEITGSTNPYEHQEQAIKHLLGSTKKSRDLIINGGTFSGKSLSFIVPGIIKQISKESDFVVIFYPSKQLLLDQFERVKEYLVKFEEKTGIRLTCEKYSGDLGKTNYSRGATQVNDQELSSLEKNPPNVLLATFDKFWYQYKNGNSSPLIKKIASANYFVFDEIHAFDGYAAANIKGFIAIHKKANPQSQFVLSSATIDNVEGFRDGFLPNGKIITCPPVRGEIEFIGTAIEHTVSLLADFWKEMEKKPGKIGLVFLDSKEDIELLTDLLCQKLKQDDTFFDPDTVQMIHADLPYAHRKRILDELRKGSRNIIRILISSSVLELGVNIPNIQTVFNIGIPITQKDGIIQRMARNRSVPGERKANVFLFDLSKKRDSFYWNNMEILRDILETNACNPILYPKLNPKILAGQIILHIRYGINDFEEIMKFFLDQGPEVYRLARQQYTKLVSLMVLKKSIDGKVLFTSHGEKKLKVQARKKNHLVPFSIRAIKNNWSIEKELGRGSDWHENKTFNLGKISARDVLKKALPGNIITRNKEQYLVTDIDKQLKTIYVKKLLSKEKIARNSSGITNRLLDPKITLGLFAKKVKGTKIVDNSFGQVSIKQQPLAIVNANLEKTSSNNSHEKDNKNFFWQELSQKRLEELAITEKSDGIVITLKSDFLKPKELVTKKLLEYFGRILQVGIETVLSIPGSEFALAFNNNQLAIYDKGDPNGNSEYLFSHLQKIADQTLKRLTACSCDVGCKNCYGEMLGLLPKGLKECLKVLVEDLTNISEVNLTEECLEIPSEQLNFQENRIFAFSDIHLTNDLCFQDEFLEAISKVSKKADVIVINGDFLDAISEESWEVFAGFKTKALKEGFWSKLVFIRSSSIHDGNLEQFGGFLHQDYAEFEIGSEQVLFVHGNKVGINTKIVNEEGALKAAQGAKKELIKTGRIWLPDISIETHLVFGHIHQRFYDERSRVYGLGHWLRKGKPYSQKCFMLLDVQSLDSLRLMLIEDLK